MEKVDFNALKQSGFMQQIQGDYVALRLRVAGGQVSTKMLGGIQEIAERYAKGYVHLTSRQSIEIPHIHISDIEAVKQALEEKDIQCGVSGKRIRTITACQGNTVCPSGLIDASELAEICNQKYYGNDVPHKFKIGITGCPNNCLKAEENDLGIKGAYTPVWRKESCNYCTACEKLCKKEGIKVEREQEQVTLTKNCVQCGKCVKVCKKGALSAKQGYKVYFGGLFGNQIATAKQYPAIVENESQLHELIQQAVVFYREHGEAKERFRKTIDRVGWDVFWKAIEE